MRATVLTPGRKFADIRDIESNKRRSEMCRLSEIPEGACL